MHESLEHGEEAVIVTIEARCDTITVIPMRCFEREKMSKTSSIISNLRTLMARRSSGVEVEWDVLLAELVAVEITEFHEIVLPYLESSRRFLPDPLGRVDSASDLEAVAARIPFARLVLDLGGDDDPIEELARVVSSPGASNLVGLDIGCCDLGDKGVGTLADHIGVVPLEYLYCGANNISSGGVLELLSGDKIADLRELHLPSNDIGVLGTSALLDSGLSSLELLDLSDNRIDVELESYTRGGRGRARFSSKRLELANNRIHDADVIRFIEGDDYPVLEYLGLAGNGIGDQPALSLLKGDVFPALRTLDLSRNRISSRTANKLMELAWGRGITLDVTMQYD